MRSDNEIKKKIIKRILLAVVWLAIGLFTLLTRSVSNLNYACVWIVLLLYLFVDVINALVEDENL